MHMPFIYDDGGREAAGFKGHTGDCGCRAAAIVTGQPYREVYDAINVLAKDERIGKRKRTRSHARTGVYRKTLDRYMKSQGFEWFPTMAIGSGCQVHLAAGELPEGRLLVRVSKHFTAVVDGTVRDTYDPQRTTIFVENSIERHAERCVYGYWHKI